MDENIVDLEEVVKVQAWEMYKETKKKKKTFPKKPEEVNIIIDWSGVHFDTEKPKYDEIGTDEVSNVIFSSVFENKTDEPQTQTLKIERQTVSSCVCSLSKGYTTGLNMALEISAPENIAKASVGFSKGFTIKNNRETTDQKTLTWTKENHLTVAKGTKLVAEFKIKERQIAYTFSTRVAIKGTVVVNFYSRRDNNKYLMTFTGDMKEMLLEDKNIPVSKTEGRSVYLEIKGECKFAFGIEQQIVLTKSNVF